MTKSSRRIASVFGLSLALLLPWTAAAQTRNEAIYTYQPPTTYTVAPLRAVQQTSPCGNGIKDDGEACDDGNRVSGDGCSSDCFLEMVPTEGYRAEFRPSQPASDFGVVQRIGDYQAYVNLCGNGQVDKSPDGKQQELCDDGPGGTCKDDCSGYILAYSYSKCGDGKVDSGYGEECEPPNTATCSADCKTIADQPTTQPTDPCAGLATPAEQDCCKTYVAPTMGNYLMTAKYIPSSEDIKKAYNCCVNEGGPANFTAEEQAVCLGKACADFDPSKDYDGEPCTKESCEPASGKIIGKMAGQCLSTEPECDPATCNYRVPECKVVAQGTAAKGDTVTATVSHVAGFDFYTYDCKEVPASGATAAAVLVNQSDFNNNYSMDAYSPTSTDATFSRSAVAYQTRDVTARATPNRTYAADSNVLNLQVTEYEMKTFEAKPTIKEGTFATQPLQSDTVIVCTVTGQGGASAPCETTVRVGECSFSCGQPDGDPSGSHSTSVDLDADCKLLKKPDASACTVSIDGGANAAIPAEGRVKVPVDDSGVRAFDVLCQDANFKATCGDKIEVAPVCKGPWLAINGVMGASTARQGDTVVASVSPQGTKSCTFLVNGQKVADDDNDNGVSFKVEGQGDVTVSATCLGNTDLKGNSLVAECPEIKIPVAPPQCGNGQIEKNPDGTTEVCDDGNNFTNDACIGCKPSSCGDGYVEAGKEECDLGAANSDEGDCTTKCVEAKCGDGHLRKGKLAEGCDDGNWNVNDGCSSACAKEICGDGIVQANEACDGGTNAAGQACKDCLGFEPASSSEEKPSGPGPTTPPSEPEPKTEETPRVVDIPWVAAPTPPPPPPPAPPAAAVITPVYEAAPVAEPTTQPADPCLKDYPDVNSQGYKCCTEYKASRSSSVRQYIEQETTVEIRRITNFFECCMAPENTDGVLSRTELMACECTTRPEEPLCSCLGPHQADIYNACLKKVESPYKFAYRAEPLPPSYVFSFGKSSSREISMPVCACPSPQAFTPSRDYCEDIGTVKEAEYAEPSRIYDYPCLYPEQVESLKKAGNTVETVAEGYRITATMSSSHCLDLGGTMVSKDPPLIERRYQDAVAVDAIDLADTSEQNRRNIITLDRQQDVSGKIAESTGPTTQPTEATGPTTRPTTEQVVCTFVKPACPCEAPPPPPETPETPQPACGDGTVDSGEQCDDGNTASGDGCSATCQTETPPPPAKLTGRLAVCLWGESEAMYPDTNEVVSLKTPCPELTRKAITSPEAYELYKTVSAYYDKPEDPARKKKLLDAISARLTSPSEPEADPAYGLSTLVVGDSDGATIHATDRKAIRDLFAVQKTLVLNADGTLTVNDVQALEVLSAGLTASADPKNVTTLSGVIKTSSSSLQPRLLATFDGAHAEGGSCSLTERTGSHQDLPTAVWTLAAALLTLMVWRFRPLRRRASIRSSTNTRAKGSSTKN